MNILFPVAEANPLYKIGGLGDVGGALPIALTQLDVDVRIALPKHPEIDLARYSPVAISDFTIRYHDQTLPIQVVQTTLPGSAVPVYLFIEDTYLSKHTDAADNHADKFAVFSLAVSTWISRYSPYWQPHIIHCHDWHTALIPVILKHHFPDKHYKTMITIHNLAYQGVTKTPVARYLNIPSEACQIISWDNADGDLNILLEGLLHTDLITTVSTTYAKEILSDEYGEKINHILESRKARIIGVLNGIDTQNYNPAVDPHLYQKYDASNWALGKQANRSSLRRDLNLPTEPDRYLISFIGRVDPYQKGIGLIIQALNQNLLPPENTDFIFLGTGDPGLENELHQAATHAPHVRIITRFDEPLARKIYAASHLTLIPSRFEPCGLVQLIAMRYGTLPVARATGGLIDTIIDNQTGFLFNEYSALALTTTLNLALKTIDNPNQYQSLVTSAQKINSSWIVSAQQYLTIYDNIVLGKMAINPHD